MGAGCVGVHPVSFFVISLDASELTPRKRSSHWNGAVTSPCAKARTGRPVPRPIASAGCSLS